MVIGFKWVEGLAILLIVPYILIIVILIGIRFAHQPAKDKETGELEFKPEKIFSYILDNAPKVAASIGAGFSIIGCFFGLWLGCHTAISFS